MRRVIAGALTLVLVAVLMMLQVTVAEPAAAATISVSPVEGRAGSSATVEGRGFLLDLTVNLCWDGAECSNLGTSPVLLGNFSAGITIPADAPSGSHSVSVCGALSGCGPATFVVLSAPETETTIPDTTTTSAPTTTTTLSTTTSTAPATTTTPPRPTTTRPGPTTTTTSPPPTVTTTTATTPPPTVTTTTVPGQAGSNSSTSTTEGVVFTTDTTLPLPDEVAPFSLDIEALVAQLFAPDPETPVDPEATTGSTVAGGLSAPLGPGSSTTVAAGEEADDGIDFSLGEASADTGGFQPKFGIWLLWLAGIVGLGGIALVFDEKRRRNR